MPSVVAVALTMVAALAAGPGEVAGAAGLAEAGAGEVTAATLAGETAGEAAVVAKEEGVAVAAGEASGGAEAVVDSDATGFGLVAGDA